MNEPKIESWRHVWRKAVAPLLSTEGLIALKQGLERDDPALIQGATTTPPPLMCVQDVEYRIVPRFPAYMIGSDGSLWTKHMPGAKGKRLSDHWIRMKGGIEKNGYVRDTLRTSDECRRVRRHVIVLETFVGPRPDGMEACHTNDVKSDNRLHNLCWGTRSQNVHDAHRNGLLPTGAARANAKLDMVKAEAIRQERISGDSLRTLAGRYSVSIGTIRQVLSHKTYIANPPKSSDCEAACAIGYCGWRGDGLETVGEVEEFFARVSYETDNLLGEPGGVRHWLNEYDSWDRETMRKELLPEVELELEKRK